MTRTVTMGGVRGMPCRATAPRTVSIPTGPIARISSGAFCQSRHFAAMKSRFRLVISRQCICCAPASNKLTGNAAEVL